MRLPVSTADRPHKNRQQQPKQWQPLPLFEGLSRNDLQIIEECSALKAFPGDAHLLTRGDYSPFVYVLVEGRVKIYLKDSQGFCVTLGLREVGEVLGEVSAIDGQKPSANVKTVEPSLALRMRKEDFLGCLQTLPSFAFNVSKVLAQRVRLATTSIAVLSTMDARCRIARQLLALSSENCKSPASPAFEENQSVLPTHLTQQDLAEMVGCSRAQVNRALMQFKKAGLIAKSPGKALVVLDRSGLKEHVS